MSTNAPQNFGSLPAIEKLKFAPTPPPPPKAPVRVIITKERGKE